MYVCMYKCIVYKCIVICNVTTNYVIDIELNWIEVNRRYSVNSIARISV